MSLPIKPGHETTEHARAWRAEVIGDCLVSAGVMLLLAGYGWKAVAICAIGAALIGSTAVAYFAARSGPKAAAVRRPVDQAPRGV